MGLQILSRRVGDVTVVDLAGRATIGAGNDLLHDEIRKMIDGGVQKLLVNLAGLTQIDSSGISTLVRMYVSLGRRNGSLKLLTPVGRVREVLELTRLLGAIPTFDDEAQALASFR